MLSSKHLGNDKIFKALANVNRRRILEIVKDNSGINITTLCKSFSTTRFAIMKDLNTLEKAGLIITKREKSSKKLFLKIDPLKNIVEDWFETFW